MILRYLGIRLQPGVATENKTAAETAGDLDRGRSKGTETNQGNRKMNIWKNKTAARSADFLYKTAIEIWRYLGFLE